MHCTSKILATAAVALAIGAAPSAHAAVAPGTVSANVADGLSYTANSQDNVIFISQNGNQLTVNDVVPLKAGAGCAPVAGDATKATCVVPPAKRFTVNAGSGDDSVTNLTSLGMKANGSIGEDSLYGGIASDILEGGPDDDRLRGDGGNDQLVGESGSDSMDGSGGADSLFGGADNDTLRGGAGDNDYLDGGKGADKLDGGAGEHDLVTYEFRSAYVGVTLAQPNTSVSTHNGEQGENDEITEVEDARGSAGNDLLIGNERDNQLSGYVGGSSTLIGRAGADVLVGTDGADYLHAGDAFGGFVNDGAFDRLLAGSGTDTCIFSTIDADFASQCE